MTIPSTVMIAGLEYTVVLEPNCTADGRPCDGYIDYQQLSIHLDEEQVEAALVVTFLHEVTHGMAHALGMDHAMSESNVSRWSGTWYQLLRENPTLFA